MSADPAGADRRTGPNQPTAKLQPRPPTRITPKAGEAQSTVQVSLKAGEAAQFVIRGKIGQILMIDADSKDLEIKMVKGKDAAQMSEPGHYDSTLVANGDFVFQVKNTAKGEVKAALNVLISDTGISKR
ncbi:MAG: hypothetical protein SF172_16755 [Burkholderiales bacterium]|nr:hypothetical protein [Burkholderiales bacterium]